MSTKWAKSEKGRAWFRARQRQRLAGGVPPDAIHGKVSTSRNYGCRCPDCTEAERIACAEYQRRVHPRPLGTPMRDNRPWSEEDREIALDTTIPLGMRADLVCRTTAAVKRYRQRVLKERHADDPER